LDAIHFVVMCQFLVSVFKTVSIASQILESVSIRSLSNKI